MKAFKLTTWNVEHADKTLTALEDPDTRPRARAAAQAKIAAIRAEIAALDPDILFVCEGPKGSDRAARYFAMAAPQLQLITRPAPDASGYGIQGTQWLWFLMKPALAATTQPELLPLATWRAFVEDQSESRHAGGKWRVSMPEFERDKANPADMGRQTAHELYPHSHYRQPQVLRFTYGGLPVEIIGVHMKSKFVNQREPWMKWSPPVDAQGRPSRDYDDIVAAIRRSTGFMVEAVQARSKLTTEAADIRYYIERRFAQDADPAIFLVGDVNDGPGKELIEEWFMLHDLIGNLQGSIFDARTYLNHALFDFEETLRWTVEFEDAIDPRRPPTILIDHIMFTQRLSGRDKGGILRVMPKAGMVEHLIHETAAATLSGGETTSDHRPVSVTVTAVNAQGEPLVA